MLIAAGPVWAQNGVADLPPLGEPAWLSDTITRPHANVATDASVPEITVLPLDAVQLDAVGLLPNTITGLPAGLWGTSRTEDLARLMRAQPIVGLPAMQSFTQRLALAELDPPRDAPPEGSELFLARLDMLLDRGALDPAQALMERAGPTEPSVFRRFFDVSLLTGHGQRACAVMNANPDIAPTFPARIFCLARGGDWSAAALSLDTGEVLGRITEDEADLIARFLDPELFEGEPPLPPDTNLTPLEFQMRMAIAERPDASGLPLAFVHADLNVLAGWRAQLDAAERLTRSGAIAPQQWLAIYTAQTPSASGAVWDRVGALQAFDAALLAGDPAETSARLGPAWTAMEEAGLEVAFAEIYADRLLRLPLTGRAGILARRVGLLSPIYEEVAQSAIAQDPAEAFAFDIARGVPATPPAGADLLQNAIASAFSSDPPAHRYSLYLEENRLGEALLRAALVLAEGRGDGDDLADALILLRAVGLEDVARRSALQLLLLEA
ncbi:hypothetical protein V8J82_15615 [Gymnodinialimonas sp. 2305UL16-5]|uniref:hypothetical protein n=1 Tax=Gymnodinialimonas mytili TaxID=3126503 RepID=UPI0030A5CE3D